MDKGLDRKQIDPLSFSTQLWLVDIESNNRYETAFKDDIGISIDIII